MFKIKITLFYAGIEQWKSWQYHLSLSNHFVCMHVHTLINKSLSLAHLFELTSFFLWYIDFKLQLFCQFYHCMLLKNLVSTMSKMLISLRIFIHPSFFPPVLIKPAVVFYLWFFFVIPVYSENFRTKVMANIASVLNEWKQCCMFWPCLLIKDISNPTKMCELLEVQMWANIEN